MPFCPADGAGLPPFSAGACWCAFRRIPGRLWRGALHWRVFPAARCAFGVSVCGGDHGAIAVAADGGGGGLVGGAGDTAPGVMHGAVGED